MHRLAGSSSFHSRYGTALIYQNSRTLRVSALATRPFVLLDFSASSCARFASNKADGAVATPPNASSPNGKSANDALISLDPSTSYTLPSLRSATRAPSVAELRKQAAAAGGDGGNAAGSAVGIPLGPGGALGEPLSPVIPRRFEEPASAKAKSWLFNALCIAIAGLTVLVLRAVVFEDGKKKNQLLTIAAQLRQQRAAAKLALEQVTTQKGELPLSSGSNGSSKRTLRYQLTGDPKTASVIVLLAAEDGETSSFWGFVHSLLVNNNSSAPAATATATATAKAAGDVCVVSFHCDGLKQERGVSRPLSLRAADSTRLLTHLLSGRPSPTSTSSSPKVVMVSHGEGAWGNLAFTALDNPSWVSAGSVCVAPLVMHRGQSLAWWEAVAGASRFSTSLPHPVLPASSSPLAVAGTEKDDDDDGYEWGMKKKKGGDLATRLLQQWLDPPPLPSSVTAPSNSAARAEDARLLTRLDEGSSRRKAAVNMGERLGLGTASDSSEKDKRLAEDFRRARAKEPVLGRSDVSMLAGLWKKEDQKEGRGRHRPAPVAVVTHGFSSFPPHIHSDSSSSPFSQQRLALQYWWLQAALAVGVFTAPDSSMRKALRAFREENRADVVSELSGGQLAISDRSPSPGAGPAGAAGIKQGAAGEAAGKGASTGGKSKGRDEEGDEVYSLIASSTGLLKETSSGSLAGADAETRFLHRAISQAKRSMASGIKKLANSIPFVGRNNGDGSDGEGEGEGGVSKSFTFLALQRELKLLTSSPSLSPSPFPPDFSVTLVQGPTLDPPSVLHTAAGQLDTLEAALTVDTVALIPLQSPGAVVEAIASVLQQPRDGCDTSTSTASSNESGGEGRGTGAGRGRFKYYGRQRSLEELLASHRRSSP